MKTEVLERATGLARAVIRVGDGRGFVVEWRKHRFVLTAAHCLPKLPPAHPWSHTKERTYEALLGPLGATPTVWAECQFADPVADIAILSGPDGQLGDQWEAYEEFLADKVPLAIGNAPKQRRKRVVLPGGGPFSSFMKLMPGLGSARLLSLGGRWIECRVERRGPGVGVVEESRSRVVSGMSGSPIMMADQAIGLISTEVLSPVLKDCLPAWFLRR